MNDLQKYYFIKVNSHCFTVLSRTLDKFQDSLFYKVIKGETCDFLLFDNNNTIIADIDPQSLSFILNYMRGYRYDAINEPLLSNVYYDAERLKISTLLSEIKAQISSQKIDMNLDLLSPKSEFKSEFKSPISVYENIIETEPINLNNFLRSLNDINLPKENNGKENLFTEASDIEHFKCTTDISETNIKNSDIEENISNPLLNTSSSKKNQKTLRPKKIELVD